MKKNFETRECVEMVAAEGYVMTNFKDGDERINFAKTAHVQPAEVAEWHAMEEYKARMKRIELQHAERERRNAERAARIAAREAEAKASTEQAEAKAE